MERKNHSSLPPNYLTLAQLHERWLKQHNEDNESKSQDKGENQEQDQQSPKQNFQNQSHLQVAAPTNESASKSRHQKRYAVKIQHNSATNRLTAVVESDDRLKSVTEAGDGDKTSYLNLDGKGKVSKWKEKHRHRKVNPKKANTEAREASGEGSGTTAQEKEKSSDKATIESEVNEVEESVRVLSINSGNRKEKGKSGEMNTGFRDFHQRRRRYQQNKIRVGSAEKKMVWVRKDEI